VDILVVYEPFLFDVEIESSLLDRAKGMEEKNKYKKSLNRMRDWRKIENYKNMENSLENCDVLYKGFI
jgi:hypothetical protein